jgi:hypothetical protein
MPVVTARLLRRPVAPAHARRPGRVITPSRLLEVVTGSVLRESAGTVTAIVISSGLSPNRSFYTPEAIASLVPLLSRRPAHIDHPRKSDDIELPERSVTSIAGRWTRPRLIRVQDEATGQPAVALEANLVLLDSDAGRLARELCRASLEAQQDGEPGWKISEGRR